MTYHLTVAEAEEALRQALDRADYSRKDADRECECGHPKRLHRPIQSAAEAAGRTSECLTCHDFPLRNGETCRGFSEAAA